MSDTRSSLRPSHAVVIGASIGGLLAARALADHFQHVTIVERDRLPTRADSRRGVPQADHSHGLLAGGCEALEDLLPGLSRALIAKGALDGDILADSIWYAQGVYLARKSSHLDGLLVSRGLLEHEIRSRVAAVPNVTILDGAAVRTLAFDGIARRAVGVVVDGRDDLACGVDLVVDASGRGSRAPAWLEALGYAPPTEDRIEVGIGYTTRLYRRDRLDLGGKLVALCGACGPAWRFGVALAQEDARWSITLGGYFGDTAPGDDDGFRAFAESLPASEIGSLLHPEAALSEARTYRFEASVRRRYETLARFPRGFLVLGDALCSFNPVYGQGMTVAAMQARALRACLEGGFDRLAPRFYAAAARLLETPWQIAVGADLAHPRLAPAASRVQRGFNWYIARLHRAAARDPELSQIFIAVANLTAPPVALLHPSTAGRVLLGNLPRLPRLRPRGALLAAE